jgi:hypothetical protein
LRFRRNETSSITPGTESQREATDLPRPETSEPVLADPVTDDPIEFPELYIPLWDDPELTDVSFTEHSPEDPDNSTELQGGDEVSSLILLEEALRHTPVTLDPETNSAVIATEDILMSDIDSDFSDLEDIMDKS